MHYLKGGIKLNKMTYSMLKYLEGKEVTSFQPILSSQQVMK